jgi:hypothetical protein
LLQQTGSLFLASQFVFNCKKKEKRKIKKLNIKTLNIKSTAEQQGNYAAARQAGETSV